MRGNCIINHVIEGKIEGRIEVRGGRERRCKQLLDHLNKGRGYCRLKEEVLFRSLRRTSCGRVGGLVVRQAVMNTYVCP